MASSTNDKSHEQPQNDWQSAGLRYHSLNFFCQKTFGGKVWKLSLDAGCSCPNRDGTLGTLGCVFCDIPSFSPSRRKPARSLIDQLEEGTQYLFHRRSAKRFIAYFQPATNTYGSLDHLRRCFLEAAEYPGVVGVSIGTRPDCMGNDILDMLADVAGKTWLLMELGVQTIHDHTLDRINRGHHFDAFLDAYERTHKRNLDIGAHLILGLPGESREDMLATAQTLAKFRLHSIKLHNLYAVRGTRLAEQVEAGQVLLPTLEEHVQYVVDFLEETPASCVIDRISGDAPREFLLGPEWCCNKTTIREAVQKEFCRRGTRQGSKCPKQSFA
jgi:uncharacterized protein